MSLILSDPPSERALLAGLCQYGNNAYADMADIIQESTFTDDLHSIIFKCIKYILDNDDAASIEISLIQSAAHTFGLSHVISKSEHLRYIKALFDFPIGLDNIRRFAAKIRKLEVAKLLHKQLGKAQDKMLEIKGDENIAQILGIAEDAVLDFTALLNDDDNSPKQLGEHIDEYLQYLIDNPVEQVGISTGFPAFDQAIGGGLRPATINIIASRSKIGKSTAGNNIGYHIANNDIPVLNLDTEMTTEDNIHRMLALINEIPINSIETGRFAKKLDWKYKVLESATHLKRLPYYYKSIAGKPFEEQIALMRRWITRVVELNDDGTAKPCVIIYDYLKLMDTQGISQDLKEYQLLGFMMTTLHNFATRYKIPILAFIQLNRDGITKESTDAASGSDRIIWLCSNFTIFKMKSDEEIQQDGSSNGNRKLVPIVTRHGPGMEHLDYINCHMKGWCAKITEGKTKFEIATEQEREKSGFIVEDNDERIQFE